MIVCVDIGGGTTRVGFSKDSKSFENIEKFSTPEEFEDEIKLITQEINKQFEKPQKIVIAAAGTIDNKSGQLLRWGQRPGWIKKNFIDSLKKVFPNTPLQVKNDAQLACLGEAVFGAGKNYVNVGYVTLSTGIGGALVVEKKIVGHRLGFEPGEMILNPEGPEWGDKQKGIFEAYSSGTAFEKTFGVATQDCDDPAIWEKYSEYLAIGVSNVLLLWSPDILIIGGGVSKKFDSFIGPLNERLKKLTPTFSSTPIVQKELNEPGLYGGLVL